MRHALVLARRGLGRVWPNPAVGCVLVKEGAVIAVGWTQPGGRPHAERVALDAAGEAARGATAYVSLEPCSHHGKTPPCADALAAAGVARVVAACVDPDPRVSGRGLARLRGAGVAVTEGVLAAEARELNAGFFSRITRNRPWVRMKVAATLDGRIATAAGESKWITGERARAEGHRLRAEADAVLTGAGTLAADDPLLTVRLPGLAARQPVRIVLEGREPVSATAKLWKTAADSPVWLISARRDAARDARLAALGVRCLPAAAGADGRPEVAAVLELLAGEGLTRLLLEAGARLNAAFLAADAVDAVSWFRAPALIGGDGMPGVAAFGLVHLAEMPRFRLVRRLPLDGDALEDYQRNA
ncbi:MAG: bifunctional diaminohydroxyphosphoribosylaminopyrimidine deaminase/5-amino-6-(5-phosphoribosylamino)uracil reductase RibD [Rhodospirillaceae bacterium]